MIKRKSIYFLFLMIFTLLFGVLVSSCEFGTKDTKAPEFSNAVEGILPEKRILVKTTTSEADLLADVEAIDKKDGKVEVVVSIGNFDFNVVGEYTITYSAADKAGNTATVSRKIVVYDNIAPYFVYANIDDVLPAVTSLQYKPINLLDFEYLDVIDNYYTNLTISVEDDDNFSFETAGTYTITYKVEDGSGNFSYATLQLTIEPAILYTEDVLEINGDTHKVIVNGETMLENDNGIRLRLVNAVHMFTKAEYLSQVEMYKSRYADNGQVPFLPWGIAVIVDENLKPVLIRNATYGIEARLVEGVWELLKGQDLTFIDSTSPSVQGAGILGGNFEDFIPDGGFVLLAGSPYGGTLDTAKIFLIKHTLAPTFAGGAVTWNYVEGAELRLPNVQFTYLEDYSVIYPKPDPMPAPEIEITNHVLSWEAITGADHYDIYVDGVKVLETQNTSILTLDLELAPSLEDEFYLIKVQAISSDIRFYGDSPFSIELQYVMPNATILSAPTLSILDGILAWDEVEGASSYDIYIEQLTEEVIINTTSLSYSLKDDDEIKNFVGNAFFYVKAKGDNIEHLDSEASNKVVYFCSLEQVIIIGEERIPVIVTTVEDYFGRRNLTGDLAPISYVSKDYVYLITDAENLTSSLTEAFSFVVLFNSSKQVKAIINILTTTNQFFDGEWVSSSDIGYSNNQIIPLLSIVEEGDSLLIGRTGGSFNVAGFNFTNGRDVLAHLFWGPFTSETITANQPWRSEHSITVYPQYNIALADETILPAPELQVLDTIVSFGPITGATRYIVSINGNVVDNNLTNNQFDMLDYIETLGTTGASGCNYSDYIVEVVPVGSDDALGLKGTISFRIKLQIQLADGSYALDVNYNVLEILQNNGSGANCRLNDTTSSLITGAKYLEALALYVTDQSAYQNNAYHPFMQNGFIIVLDEHLKVKFIRFGFVNPYDIDKFYNITSPTTWNNGTVNPTTGGGNFLNLENEISSTDYVIIVTNSGAKVQLTAACELFINTDSNAILVTRIGVGDASIEATRVDIENANYSLNFTSEIL